MHDARPATFPESVTFTREQEVAEFGAVRLARRACWAAVLSAPRRALDVVVAAFAFPARAKHEVAGAKVEREAAAAFSALRESGRAWLEWTGAREAYLSKGTPGPLLERTLSACTLDLAAALADADVDDLALGRACADVAAYARGGRGKVPAEWGPFVAAARAALLAAVRGVEARHVGLCFAVARTFAARTRFFSIEDLAGYAAEGLRTAVLRYDERRGLRFSTYATHWLRHRVGRAIEDHGRTIRLPVHVLDLSHKIAGVRRRASLAGLPMPTPEEVASTLGVTPRQVRQVDAAVRASEPVTVDASPIGDMRGTAASDTADEHYGGARLDTLADDSLPDPVEAMHSEVAAARAVAAVEDLPPAHREVIRRRVLAEEPETLAEVGMRLGVSRERVRQIQERALAGLRDALRECPAQDLAAVAQFRAWRRSRPQVASSAV